MAYDWVAHRGPFRCNSPPGSSRWGGGSDSVAAVAANVAASRPGSGSKSRGGSSSTYASAGEAKRAAIRVARTGSGGESA
jgi:hypothetical protein